jgi:hypothetical protein
MIHPDSDAATTTERLNDLLPALPPAGVVYGIEMASHPDPLTQKDSAYTLFVPPSRHNFLSVALAAATLYEGVGTALRHAYPPQWRNLASEIPAADFDGFAAYYNNHPDTLPKLAWSPKPAALDTRSLKEAAALNERGPTEGTGLLIGHVTGPGMFPLDDIYPSEPTTVGDVGAAEEEARDVMLRGEVSPRQLEELRRQEFMLQRPALAKNRLFGQLALDVRLRRPFGRFDPAHQEELMQVAMRQGAGRELFHQALGRRILNNFITSLEDAYV